MSQRNEHYVMLLSEAAQVPCEIARCVLQSGPRPYKCVNCTVGLFKNEGLFVHYPETVFGYNILSCRWCAAACSGRYGMTYVSRATWERVHALASTMR